MPKNTDWHNIETGKIVENGRKFVLVVITKIGVSESQSSPVRIVFEYKNKEYYIDVSFSNTNVVFIDDDKFDKNFSFENPKLKYPNIPTSTWEIITQEKVRIGMSKEACILSWGEPEDINKTSGSWGVHEQWVYGSHSYLYFTNGRLTSIQN